MVKVTFVSYAGQVLEVGSAEDRADAVRQLAEYPGAGSAVLEGPRGVETVGKGNAFVAIDGASRERRAVWRDNRPSYNAIKSRSPRTWYGAAALRA